MSVDRTAMIVRGIQVGMDTWNKLSDDFKDEWGINFNNWCDGGPYIIGYVIQRGYEGKAFELRDSYTDDSLEALIAESAIEGIEISEANIKTYFGVAVW